MTDITNISQIPAGNDMTAEQIKSILNKLIVTYWNLLNAGKYANADYEIKGDAGKAFKGQGNLDNIRRQIEYWKAQLQEYPCEDWSIFDDPSL